MCIEVYFFLIMRFRFSKKGYRCVLYTICLFRHFIWSRLEIVSAGVLIRKSSFLMVHIRLQVKKTLLIQF